MAYIGPQTQIELLQDVPLNENQTDTLHWESVPEQIAYFDSKVIPAGRFTEQSFQRVQRGYARVEAPFHTIASCNYMRFKNNGYSSKWFYAFVTKCEYINDVTTEIQFVIDPIQTWWFEFSVKPCHVLRHHTDTDWVGFNVMPEPVNIGEYIHADNNYREILNLTDNKVLVAGVNDIGFLKAVDGAINDNNYSALTLYAMEITDGELAETRINNIMTRLLAPYFDVNRIPLLYVAPHWCFKDKINLGEQNEVKIENAVAMKEVISGTQLTPRSEIDGYIPKNNKLYTYPYHFFTLNNGLDSSLTIRYEYCKGLRPKFEFNGNKMYPIGVTARPLEYKRTGENEMFHTESCSISNFPMSGFNVDNFVAWVAQNSIPMTINTLADVAIMKTPGMERYGRVNAISDVASTLSGVYTNAFKADIVKGNLNNGSTEWGCKTSNFYGGRMSLNAQDLQRIDDFFTRYGYTCGLIVENPKKMTRERFMYVQTADCHIVGDLPADDCKAIEDIFNKGITFWKDKNYIFDYEVQNNPLVDTTFYPPNN